MILKVIGTLYITWVLYCAIMALWKAQRDKTLTPACWVLGAPLLAAGLLFDAVSNLIASLVLWHLPREFLLTQKLQRIQREQPTGWRNRVAKWVCKNLLNPVDPTGHHC